MFNFLRCFASYVIILSIVIFFLTATAESFPIPTSCNATKTERSISGVALFCARRIFNILTAFRRSPRRARPFCIRLSARLSVCLSICLSVSPRVCVGDMSAWWWHRWTQLRPTLMWSFHLSSGDARRHRMPADSGGTSRCLLLIPELRRRGTRDGSRRRLAAKVALRIVGSATGPDDSSPHSW